MDAIQKQYLNILIESKVNYSPDRSHYNGPLSGELISSPNLSVDDHLKAIEWSHEQIRNIENGTHKWSFNPLPADKEIATRNHKALISAHKDQIDRMADAGNPTKD